MKFRWWAWLPSLLPLLVLACGDGGPEPPPIPEREPPFPEKEPASLATPATAEEELLASMVLTVEEVGEVFPDQGWRVFSHAGGVHERLAARRQSACRHLHSSWSHQ